MLAEAESETQEKDAKWVGRPAGNSGFEVMEKGVRVGTQSEGWRERIPDCIGAATMKLRAPNEVRTYGLESKLVLTT